MNQIVIVLPDNKELRDLIIENVLLPNDGEFRLTLNAKFDVSVFDYSNAMDGQGNLILVAS